MAKRKSKRNQVTVNADLFGSAPLLENEDEQAYNELLSKIYDNIKPMDFIEEMWARDCADQYWETLRLRRHKAELIKANMQNGLRSILLPVCKPDGVLRLTGQYPVRQPETMKEIDEVLEALNMSMTTVEAKATAQIIDKIERLDRMIATSEARRIATLHEIERHRANLGPSLRKAQDNVQDADFIELEAAQPDTSQPENSNADEYDIRAKCHFRVAEADDEAA